MKYTLIRLLHLLPLITAYCVIPMSFDVLRGPSIHNAIPDKHRSQSLFSKSLHKRDDGFSIDLADMGFYYSVPFSIGGVQFQSLLDTGSSDLWLYGSSNPYCIGAAGSTSKGIVRKPDVDGIYAENEALWREELEGFVTPSVEEHAAEVIKRDSPQATIDCSSQGILDEASPSFTNEEKFFLIQYADHSFARGTWGTADLTIGGVTLQDFQLAVANVSNSSETVFGIGFERLEASNLELMKDHGGSFTYANLPAALKEDGIISKMMYSVYLDADDAKGHVLFGGIDSSKFKGELVTLPLVNIYESEGQPDAITFDVMINSVSLSSSKNGEQTVMYQSTSGVLDTGTSYIYLHPETVQTVRETLGAEFYEDAGAYLVDCPDKPTGISLNFAFDGLTVPVPIEDALTPIDDSYDKCVLRLYESDRAVLGDTFLRQVYAVFDLEDHVAQLALYQSSSQSKIEVARPSKC